MATISHQDENGTPNGQVVELYEMTPWGAKDAKRKRRRKRKDVKYQIDDEEEDELPKDAFDQYYLAHEEDEESVVKANRDNLYNSPPNDSLLHETTRGWDTIRLVIGCNKEFRKIFKLALPSTFSSISSAFLSAMSKSYYSHLSNRCI